MAPDPGSWRDRGRISADSEECWENPSRPSMRPAWTRYLDAFMTDDAFGQIFPIVSLYTLHLTHWTHYPQPLAHARAGRGSFRKTCNPSDPSCYSAAVHFFTFEGIGMRSYDACALVFPWIGKRCVLDCRESIAVRDLYERFRADVGLPEWPEPGAMSLGMFSTSVLAYCPDIEKRRGAVVRFYGIGVAREV